MIKLKIKRWICGKFGHKFQAFTLRTTGVQKIYCARCGQWRA